MQSEVYEVPRRLHVSLAITNLPSVKLLERGAPYPKAKGLYKEVWPSNAFIGNLLRLILLERDGRSVQVSREIRGYYLKMAEATGTLWEYDRPEASCNHGFASYLAILLDRANQ